MSFESIEIKSEYRSLSDNVVKDFYIPLLKKAVLYKRAVGFFSSSALIEISKGIMGLIENGGKILLIASPRLQEGDIKAIKEGYKERDEIIERAILDSFSEPQNLFEEERLNLLAHLIADGKLDIKIAFINNNNKDIGIYHEKMGLLYDSNKNIVAFTGSMNETSMAFTYNYEAIDVFKSWTDEKERVYSKERAFDDLWNNDEPSIETMEFPQVALDKLCSYKKEFLNIEKDFDEDDTYIEDECNLRISQNQPSIPKWLTLHRYQEDAVDSWAKNGYRGIFDMATGTGKTLAGLSALTRLACDFKNKLAVFIVCPYQHLVEQWVEDIEQFNIKPIIGYSASSQPDWKKRLEDQTYDYDLGIQDFMCFVCTNATFASQFVQGMVQGMKKDILLIVDEAHNFGATKLQKTLNSKINYRLALSATLERHMDEEGTEKLYQYFGKKCIEYDLERAIEENKLTPYKYYPIVINLSDEELELYKVISNEISKCCMVSKDGKVKFSERGKQLAIKRSRIVAGAINKINELCNVMEPYKKEKHILVYCGATTLTNIEEDLPNIDDSELRQIDYVTLKLGNQLNMNVAHFTSRESMSDREKIKSEFEKGDSLQALIAIKCLDEGVNIPKIKTAVILASTTNPKEYIQRRGRVLRKAEGKEFAVIYDFITLPRDLSTVKNFPIEEIKYDISLIKNELKRINEFSRLAMNPVDSYNIVSEITEAYDLNKFESEPDDWTIYND